MRNIVIVLISLLPATGSSQNVYFDAKAGAEFTFPLGKLQEQFWHFPEDSTTAFKNIKAKKKVFVGAFASVEAKFQFKNRKTVKFCLETGINYYFKQYQIYWSAQSESPYGTGTFDAIYKIRRHEIGLNILPGLIYKNISFNAGLDILGIISTTTSETFLRNGNVYLAYTTNAIEELKTLPVHFAMPVYLAYTIPVSNKISISPFVCFELGIGDFDGYAVYWNRREIACLSELTAGLSLNILAKAKG